jgi:carbon monoxide dehydrogenase subunit G
MGLRIEEQCSVAAPAATIWTILTDPYRVAQCLPGATISEEMDAGTYRGAIAVKVGPVTAKYDGTITFERLEAERQEVELIGRGIDATGKGRAEVRMVINLRPTATGADLKVVADVNLSGIIPQLGGGMIRMVSSQMFRHFAAAVQRAACEVDPEGDRTRQ